MNRSIESVVESLLPALYNLQGSPEVIGIARHAAENLVSLVDTGALRTRDSAMSVPDFLNVIALDPDMVEQDVQVANALMSAVDARTGLAKVSYAQIAEAIGMSVGGVRGSVSRLRNSGYFGITHPSQKDLNTGDQCLRYRPDLQSRITL